MLIRVDIWWILRWCVFHVELTE